MNEANAKGLHSGTSHAIPLSAHDLQPETPDHDSPVEFIRRVNAAGNHTAGTLETR